MILNFYARQKSARALCSQQNLTIKYERGVDQPRTDGRIVYVPAPSPEWTEDQLVLWEYKLFHEIGHNAPDMRDIFTVAKDKGVDMRSFLGYVWNVLDDARQEHHKHDEFLGKQLTMSKGRALFLKDMMQGPSTADDDKRNAAEALFAWDTMHREGWMPDCLGLSEQQEQLLTAKGKEYFNMLKESGDRFITYGLTGEEEYEKAKELLDFLGFNSSEEEQTAQQMAAAKAGGAGEYSDLLFHAHGDAGEGSYSNGCGEAEVSGEPPEAESEWQRVSKPELNPPDGVFIPTPESEIKVYDFSKNTDCITSSREHVRESILAMPSSTGLASKTRKLLQVYSQSYYQHGLKRGRIGKNIHRATMQGVGDYSQRVFKKRIENNILDTAVAVAVDCSGSMHGEPYEHAAHSAILLNEAISKIGVPIEIVGFTDYRVPTHFVFKGYNERLDKEEIATRFAKASTKMHYNSDGESVLWTYDRLIRQPNKRKVLIVLSDGCPASTNRSGDDSQFLSDVCSSIDKSPVELYGIGIMDNSVSEYYKHWKVINDSAELESALLTVIKSKIIGK